MKVFNLRCPLAHVFEGWFASDAEFVSQKDKGWLTCPMCGSHDVVKGLSAPRLARKSNTASATPRAHSDNSPSSAAQAPAGSADDLQRIQQAWLAMSRHVVANTEDVGERFAQVARDIHEGDAQERPIRGTATSEEREALAEDGIEVMPLLLPEVSKHSLQ